MHILKATRATINQWGRIILIIYSVKFSKFIDFSRLSTNFSGSILYIYIYISTNIVYTQNVIRLNVQKRNAQRLRQSYKDCYWTYTITACQKPILKQITFLPVFRSMLCYFSTLETFSFCPLLCKIKYSSYWIENACLGIRDKTYSHFSRLSAFLLKHCEIKIY